MAIVPPLLACAAFAGDLTKKIQEPISSLPAGGLTLGAKFSEDLQSGYLDALIPFAAPGNFVFFTSIRGTLDDSSQSIFSAGLGARYIVPGHDVIIGANVFYDSIDTGNNNHFDQLGLGAEILTRWVDARFNYYLPDNSSYVVNEYTVSSSSTKVGPEYRADNVFRREIRRENNSVTYRSIETGLEGWNSEIGVLIPGLDQYVETRIFAGYYRYDVDYGKAIEGWKARAEVRWTPGIITDVEWWQDESLVGGNWVAGVRVNLPFEIGNIFQGRNPFEGASEAFRFGKKREFRQRAGEMVWRSHRIMVNNSGPQAGGGSSGGSVANPVTRNAPPRGSNPPPSSEGGGGGGGGEGGGGGGGGELPPGGGGGQGGELPPGGGGGELPPFPEDV